MAVALAGSALGFCHRRVEPACLPILLASELSEEEALPAIRGKKRPDGLRLTEVAARCGRLKIRAARSQFLVWDGRHSPCAGARGHNRSDAHAVSDRGRALGENAPRRWLAAVLAGCVALALYQRRLPGGH
jgi:hypothetical protein